MPVTNVDMEAIAGIIHKSVTLYSDKDNPDSVFAEFPDIHGNPQFEPLESNALLRFINHEYRSTTGESTVVDPSDVLERLAQDLIYEEQNRVEIAHRISGSIASGKLLYSLYDPGNSVIEIDHKGWRLAKPKDVKFVKTSAVLEQVMPSRTPSTELFDLLRPFVNMNDDDFKLFIACLVQYFSRSSSHFATVLSSEKGSGKSTLTKILQEIVDPMRSNACLIPKSIDNLKHLLSNTYIAGFDNTASLPKEIADILCAAITGTTEVKRKLYTDSDSVIMNLHNIVVLNGIDIVPYQLDLADRCLIYELLPLGGKRKTDKDFWEEFEGRKSQILGAIFDTISKAMDFYSTVTCSQKVRMADAGKEIVSIGMALGMTREEAEGLIFGNRSKLDAAYITSNPLIQQIVYFMAVNQKPLDNSANAIFELFYRKRVGEDPSYPKSASAFSRRLHDAEAILNSVGIRVERSKKRDCNWLKISYIPASQMNKSQKELRNAIDDRLFRHGKLDPAEISFLDNDHRMFENCEQSQTSASKQKAKTMILDPNDDEPEEPAQMRMDEEAYSTDCQPNLPNSPIPQSANQHQQKPESEITDDFDDIL